MLPSSSEAAGGASEYAAAIRLQAARHPQLGSNGFESILLCVEDRIVKLYRPSLLDHRPATGALAFLADRLDQLRIYAPSADARLVALLPDGTLGADPHLPEAAGWAISLRRGTPLVDDPVWADPARRMEACHKLAAALRARHCASTRLTRGLAYEELLHALLTALDGSPTPGPGAGEWPARIGRLAKRLAAAAGDGGERRLGHGDLGLDNVILINGEPQFIDAGFALLEGAGLGSEPVLDGVMWDIACMEAKLILSGKATVADGFIHAYRACTSGGGLGDAARRPWRILVLLALAAATARQLPLIERDLGPARAGSAQRSLRSVYDLLNQVLGQTGEAA